MAPKKRLVMSKDRVLVTGGGGFLGSYILKQLTQKGYKTGSLARGTYEDVEKSGTICHKGSLTDRNFVVESFKGYDAVIHVAAKAGIWGDRQSFWDPNVAGTQHVIDACKHHGIQKLVFTSSPSVVFNGLPQSGEDESLPYPTHFESHYPESKAVSEQLVLSADCPELRTCALRPHLIFGPGDPHLLPKVLARAASGKLIQVGSGENRVDLTYVEDAANAHILALERLEENSTLCGQAYFITQGEPVVLWTWLNQLLDKLNIPRIQKSIPLSGARFIGGALELVHNVLHLKSEPRLTRFLASELAQDHYYDINKAKTELGYQPCFSMDEALQKTLPYLREGLAKWLS